MALGLRVMFYPKTNEYEVVSPDGFTLRMTEADFKAIKCRPSTSETSFVRSAKRVTPRERETLN